MGSKQSNLHSRLTKSVHSHISGSISVPSSHEGLSFLDYFFVETERVHAYCRRYSRYFSFPPIHFLVQMNIHSFLTEFLLPVIVTSIFLTVVLPLLNFPEIIKPNAINLNQKIKQLYIAKIIPGFFRNSL